MTHPSLAPHGMKPDNRESGPAKSDDDLIEMMCVAFYGTEGWREFRGLSNDVVCPNMRRALAAVRSHIKGPVK